MVLSRAALVSFMLVGLSVGTAAGQASKAAAPQSPAEKAYREAVAFHCTKRFTAARNRMREATRLAPFEKKYTLYLRELEKLAEQDELDRFALETPPDVETDVERLGRYLGAAGRSDRDRARAIFRWVADRIAYDADALTTGRIGDTRAAAVLKSRKSVCEGYATLFQELGNAAGIETVKIYGYAKSMDFKPYESYNQRRYSHAWNAVRFDGNWHLLDATWAAGAVDDGRFVKQFNDYYFLVPPEQMGMTHLPAESKWQLVDSRITGDDFQRWARPNYRLFQLGFRAGELRSKYQAQADARFVETPNVPGPRIQVLQAPLERSLRIGSTYNVRIRAPGFVDMVVINGKDTKWQRLTRRDDVFEGTISGKRGELHLAGQLPTDSRKYFTALRYQVD